MPWLVTWLIVSVVIWSQWSAHDVIGFVATLGFSATLLITFSLSLSDRVGYQPSQQ